MRVTPSQPRDEQVTAAHTRTVAPTTASASSPTDGGPDSPNGDRGSTSALLMSANKTMRPATAAAPRARTRGGSRTRTSTPRALSTNSRGRTDAMYLLANPRSSHASPPAYVEYTTAVPTIVATSSPPRDAYRRRRTTAKTANATGATSVV